MSDGNRSVLRFARGLTKLKYMRDRSLYSNRGANFFPISSVVINAEKLGLAGFECHFLSPLYMY